MSLESGPAQWWHLRGILGHRAASPAAAMAPAARIDRSDPPRARGRGRDASACPPVSGPQQPKENPATAATKTLAPAEFQRPGSGHRSGRAPAAAVRFVAFRGPNGPAAHGEEEVERVFFIFIFFKIVFYKNIFSVLQFTGLYPYRPAGGRQGAGRPAGGRQGAGRPAGGRQAPPNIKAEVPHLHLQ